MIFSRWAIWVGLWTYVGISCCVDWKTGSQSSSQPAGAKKDHHSPPCVADVFHKPSSQFSCSCPNHRPWEKMRRRRRENWGRRLRGAVGGWRAWQRSDGLRQPGVWELSGKACAKCSETKYHLTARPPEGVERSVPACVIVCVCLLHISVHMSVCSLTIEKLHHSWEILGKRGWALWYEKIRSEEGKDALKHGEKRK